MAADSSAVVYLHRRMPQEALERLNRVTGLQFANWPESLVAHNQTGSPRSPESSALIPELNGR